MVKPDKGSELASHPSTNSTRHSSKAHSAKEAHAPSKARPKGGKGADDGASDDSSQSGSRVVAEREPGQFINIRYDMLVDWLAAYLTDKKPVNWIKEWKILFNRVLPLHTFIRTQSAFKHLVDEYRELDPKATEQVPLQSALPKKQKMKREKEQLDIPDEHVPQGSLPPKSEAFMHGRMSKLLLTCGYDRLPDSFMEKAKREESRHGLDVHIPPYDEVPCHIYYRDDYEKPASVRSWKTCFREKHVMDRYLRHVVMIYAFTYQKDDKPAGCWDGLKWMGLNVAHRRAIGSPESEGKVYIRCYNDIPMYDMDMLIPGSQPNPKLLDSLIVLIPFLGGLGVAIYKIVSIFHEIDNTTNVENLMIILFAIVTPFTVSFKAFIAAKNRMTQYRYHQAQMLVDHTISTNRGTMMQLMTEAADQENKEAVLAFTTLSLQRYAHSVEDVRILCNELLRTMNPESNTEFDADDAVNKLVRFGVLTRNDRGEVKTVELNDARKELALSQFEDPKPPKLRTN